MSGGGDDKVEETPLEKEDARISIEQWNDYQLTSVPFENRFIADVTGFDPDSGEFRQSVWDERKAQVRGQSAADVAQEVGRTRIDPNRGVARLGMAPHLGKTMARTARKSDEAVEDSKSVGMQAVVGMGRGQATEASLGMGKLAREASEEELGRSEAKMRESKFYGDTVGSALGVAADRVQVDDKTGEWSWRKN